jgi:hypothetical protein
MSQEQSMPRQSSSMTPRWCAANLCAYDTSVEGLALRKYTLEYEKNPPGERGSPSAGGAEEKESRSPVSVDMDRAETCDYNAGRVVDVDFS